MTYTPISSNVSAGDIVLASDHNNLRSDALAMYPRDNSEILTSGVQLTPSSLITNGAFYINNTSNANQAINLYSNYSGSAEPFIDIESGSSFSGNLLRLQHNGSNVCVSIDNNSSASAIAVSNSGSTGYGFYCYSSNSSPSYPLFYAEGANATFDEPIYEGTTTGTGVCASFTRNNATNQSLGVVYVHQDNGVGDTPCLVMAQDDTNSPIMRFNATGGAGNTLNSSLVGASVVYANKYGFILEIDNTDASGYSTYRWYGTYTVTVPL